jgi:hypothetical protein
MASIYIAFEVIERVGLYFSDQLLQGLCGSFFGRGVAKILMSWDSPEFLSIVGFARIPCFIVAKVWPAPIQARRANEC